MERKRDQKSLECSKNGVEDFILNIIVNDDGNVKGEIQHNRSGEIMYFRSLIEMILIINEKLDQSNFPQPTNQIRRWIIRKNKLCLKGGGCYE
ncbi:hypothetical protein [Clostridium sp.]|uniref:hypothetical protein n=1 Tax=Clostridium sp. TaxID=1506 RepID=UPI003D6C7A05